jgi:predicted transposase YbfD/YdcC
MNPTSISGSLYEVFAQIPDPRHRRGTIYPLPAVLTLVATSMLCGARSLAAIAQWGRDYNHLAPQLGFSRQTDDGSYRTPCISELHTLLAALPAQVFEAALTRWILAQGVADLKQRVMALDGKTLRGSQGQRLRRATEDDQAKVHGKGHGRVETREIQTTTRLTGYLDWPGVKQVCLLKRTRRIKGKTSVETVCAVTSLGPERASARQLLAISRGYWDIENRLHWVRDMSFGEDACRVRSGEAPEILAAIRNATLRLLRSSGLTELAASLRRHAAKPMEALRLVRNFAPS